MKESMFLESIACESKQFLRINYHQERVDRTLLNFGFRSHQVLLDRIEIPRSLTNEFYKCRVVYSQKIVQVEFIPYQMKNVQTLQLMAADHLDYEYKLLERGPLTDLWEKRGLTDDVLYVKNGLITDSYYANVILEKEGKWYTPQTPLLRGVMREELINQKKILPVNISPFKNKPNTSYLFDFERIQLINALLQDKAPSFEINPNIYRLK